jgi:hypothetical protein
MASRSRGAGAIFLGFSGEDSGQTGEATGKLRVARCSWSCHLSNAPRLVDQIAASRKESSREGVVREEKRVNFQRVFLTFCLCSRACLT